MAKKYAVDLSEEEQALLSKLITSGTQRVRKVNHARILMNKTTMKAFFFPKET